MSEHTPPLTVAIHNQGYTLSRLFDAPRDRVFEAWSSPDALSEWWGPKGFTNTLHQFDPRPGGRWEFTMHGPDGADYPNVIVFIAVDRPERIVFRHQQPDFVATVTFQEADGRTRLTYETLFETSEAFEQVKPYAVPGGQETLQCLEDYLQSIAQSRNDAGGR